MSELSQEARSSNWFLQLNASSADEFVNLLLPTQEYFEHSSTYDWLFRGECDWEHPLLPTIYRPSTWDLALRIADVGGLDRHKDISVESEFFLVLVEYQLLRSFMHKVDESGLSIPGYSPPVAVWLREYSETLVQILKEGPPQPTAPFHPVDNLASSSDRVCWPDLMINPILALARHYGMPSRLLDWSHSPFVAAYFAARDVIAAREKSSVVKERFSVWALSRRITGVLHEYPLPHPLEFRYIRTPSVGNKHMIAQRGVFTARTTYPHELFQHRSGDGMYDLVSKRMDYITSKEASALQGPYLIRFTLDSVYFDDLLLLLNKLGYSGNRMFPTYNGVVESLKEEIYFP